MLLNTASSILNGRRAYTIPILDHRAGMPSTPILGRGATVLVHILELHADEIEPLAGWQIRLAEIDHPA